jgi:hypothetical protein
MPIALIVMWHYKKEIGRQCVTISKSPELEENILSPD